MEAAEEAIKNTAKDALICRYSAAKVSLFVDDHLETMMSMLHLPKTIKPPIINRGTFLRWQAFNMDYDGLVISFGAGYDTRVLKHKHWYEIDFEDVMERKRHILQKMGQSHVNLIAMDLNQPDFKALDALVTDKTFTVMSECCLMYLEEGACKALCEWIARKGGQLVAFEPVAQNTPFAASMQHNLHERGIHLHYPLPAVQGAFEQVSCTSMLELESSLPEPVRAKLDLLAPLDEREEWCMMASNYALIKAC